MMDVSIGGQQSKELFRECILPPALHFRRYHRLCNLSIPGPNLMLKDGIPKVEQHCTHSCKTYCVCVCVCVLRTYQTNR